MARGWESKAIESQQEDREAAAAVALRGPVTPEEAARKARRQTLEMALARARADRQTATNPSHRQMLDAAISSLTESLTEQLEQDHP